MSSEQIEKLKQMLQSQNEADINLAGSIINNLSREQFDLFKNLNFDKEDWQEILASNFSIENKIERYLNKIFSVPLDSTGPLIFTGQKGMEEFKKLL